MTNLKSNRLDFLHEVLAELKAAHLYQELRTLESPQGPAITVNGKQCVNFSSNNYLGFTAHPKLIQAAHEALDTWGAGSGSVRSIIGTTSLHQELESRLAAFKQVEATLVLQSGFTANQAAITTVVGDEDVIISDELNHASIIDACRLLKNTKRLVYRHSDMAHLEDQLKAAASYRRRLIVTDGVFSMDGDIAKLDSIVALAEQYDAMVMVDDAHASGVLGKNGSGTTSHFNLYGRVDIQMGTLSKAVGVMGGYIAGTQALRDVLFNKGRPFLFSTSHPPSLVASCIAAIDLLENEPQHHQRLWENTTYFKEKVAELGYEHQSETPIVPLIVGSSEKAQLLSQGLFERGVYGQAIVFPTVAKDKARVRLIVTAAHTQAQMDKALEAITELTRTMNLR